MTGKCPACGGSNRPDASFCQICGARLPVPQPASSLPSMPPSAGLRASPTPSMGSPSQAYLVAQDGRQYTLVGPVITIGRDSSCNIALPDDRVSSRHAEIGSSGSGYTIRDLNSTNGTWVNGQKIGGPCSLKIGDRVVFGGPAFTFQAGVGLSVPASTGTRVVDQDDLSALANVPPASPAVSPPPAQHTWLEQTGQPLARGEVKTSPHERQDQPPTDPARMTVLISIVLLFAGLLIAFIAFALTLGVVLVCLGGAALLFIIPLLFMSFQMLFGRILSWLKDDKPVTLVNFQMCDERTGAPVDVTFMRKRGTGGGINLGDKVEVWGKWDGGASIQATRIRVYERLNKPTSAFVPVRKPWPLWVALMVPLSVLGGLGCLVYSLGLFRW